MCLFLNNHHHHTTGTPNKKHPLFLSYLSDTRWQLSESVVYGYMFMYLYSLPISILTLAQVVSDICDTVSVCFPVYVVKKAKCD